MAGKHTGPFSPIPTGTGAVVGFSFNPRVTKAYAEGRSGAILNPHITGAEAELALSSGFSNRANPGAKFETAID